MNRILNIFSWKDWERGRNECLSLFIYTDNKWHRDAGKVIHILIQSSDNTTIISVGYMLTFQIKNINCANIHS